MKNVSKKCKIKNKNTKKMVILAGGIVVFSLAGSIKFKQKNTEEYINYYSHFYLESINRTDDVFDQKFVNIYNKEDIAIGNKTYKLNSLYLIKNSDDKVYLKVAGEDNIDILTNESFGRNRKEICAFRDSSLFYVLYQNGILKQNGIENPNEFINIINTWDGEKHDKTKELLAEKRASEEYRKKYGR